MFRNFFIVLVLLISLLIFFGDNHAQVNQYHETITEYIGPSTCLECHMEEAVQMFGAVHYQWTGITPNVTNIDDAAGKGDVGFNTYCGTVITSRRIACWACHVGNGKVPTDTFGTEQLENIDCLTCHQEQYVRKVAPPFTQLTFTGYDGVNRTWTLPEEDSEGNFQFMPDVENMSISILEAARTVHSPTRASCLSCHAYAAGSDCGKRGDISSESVNPPQGADVHMSQEGANLSCKDCHKSDKHRLKGRGLDIRPNERSGWLTCFNGGCHSIRPHGNLRLNNHTGRVACQTCHIPLFATLRSTEIRRDWNNPFFFQGLFGGQGGFKPEEIRESMVIPTYMWFDGTSQVYILGQQPSMNQGVYEFGLPNGDVNTMGTFIYPMKEHFSNSALHDATSQMIPFSTFIYFVTGDFSRAVTEGQIQSGLTGAWSLVNVHTFQTINHLVQPKNNALTCKNCHQSLAGGEPVRMDLQGKLGYGLKGVLSDVCSQCHEFSETRNFVDLHDKHVSDEGIDCSWCHNFTRSFPFTTDLALTMSDSPDPVTARSLTYAINITNNGPDNANGVVLTDTLPTNVTNVSATSTQGSCGQSADRVTCDIGEMANGATVIVSIVVTTPNTPDIIYNTAIVSSNSNDPDITNNNAIADTTVISYANVTLLTPNGGEIIPSGLNYKIEWVAPVNAVQFDLLYSIDNGTTWIPIASKVSGTSYNWKVPKQWGNKKKCLVKVKGYEGNRVKVGTDESDGPFTIEVVKLTSPNGGGTITCGIPNTITWATNAAKRDVAKVKLYYTKDSGSTWLPIIALTDLAYLATGSHSYDQWIPTCNKPKDGCKVRVELKDASGNILGKDASDSYFIIQP